MTFFKKSSIPNTKSYLITVESDKLGLVPTRGSYNVICARLMGLSYPDYLRMCRDIYGATLHGKGLYITARFPNGKKLDHLIEELNARAKLVLWNKENPDFKEHEKVVENFKKEIGGLQW